MDGVRRSKQSRAVLGPVGRPEGTCLARMFHTLLRQRSSAGLQVFVYSMVEMIIEFKGREATRDRV
jgi:hypothetical protein